MAGRAESMGNAVKPLCGRETAGRPTTMAGSSGSPVAAAAPEGGGSGGCCCCCECDSGRTTNGSRCESRLITSLDIAGMGGSDSCGWGFCGGFGGGGGEDDTEITAESAIIGGDGELVGCASASAVAKGAAAAVEAESNPGPNIESTSKGSCWAAAVLEDTDTVTAGTAEGRGADPETGRSCGRRVVAVAAAGDWSC